VDDAVIALPGNKQFHIKVKGGNKSGYVKKVTLNGKPHSNIYISHAEIMKGGVLEIQMDN
jgi:putative alpha-1,2-mannosidase